MEELLNYNQECGLEHQRDYSLFWQQSALQFRGQQQQVHFGR